ncbi:unnamed protein product [Ectocarpus sp. 13 AM-2016]
MVNVSARGAAAQGAPHTRHMAHTAARKLSPVIWASQGGAMNTTRKTMLQEVARQLSAVAQAMERAKEQCERKERDVKTDSPIESDAPAGEEHVPVKEKKEMARERESERDLLYRNESHLKDEQMIATCFQEHIHSSSTSFVGLTMNALLSWLLQHPDGGDFPAEQASAAARAVFPRRKRRTSTPWRASPSSVGSGAGKDDGNAAGVRVGGAAATIPGAAAKAGYKTRTRHNLELRRIIWALNVSLPSQEDRRRTRGAADV